MEALSFLKFWKPTSTTQLEYKASGGNDDTVEVPKEVVDSESDLDEEDDSFFELELTVSDFDNKRNNCSDNNRNNIHKDNSRFDSNEERLHYSTKNAGHNGELKISKPTLSMSSSDVLSKRKILPIEPSSKPQSPMALLKSAPKLRVSIFKKSKSVTTRKTEKTEYTEKNEKQEKKLFTVKFKVQEVPNLSMFTRACSLRKTNNTDDSSSSYDTTSKRFSKDVIQKYLKLIKPLYVKVSKKNDKMRYSGQLSEASPASSPATLPGQFSMKEKQGNILAGFRVVSRHLGKSKSTSVTVSSPARRDDSLLLQHDGIQSAILHCKKSFNSSRDSSSLSRSASGSSQETFSYLSSKESSLFPRFSSDSSYEGSISARKSNEEGI